jgi:hypothetical protein
MCRCHGGPPGRDQNDHAHLEWRERFLGYGNSRAEDISTTFDDRQDRGVDLRFDTLSMGLKINEPKA